MKRLLLAVLTAIRLGAPAAGQAPGAGDALDVALGAVGLTRANARFDPEVLRAYSREAGANPMLDVFLATPFEAPYRLAHIRKDYLKNRHSFHESLMSADGFIGARVRRGKYWNPLAAIEQQIQTDGPDALFRQLERVFDASKNSLSRRARRRLREQCGALDPRIARCMALLVGASLSAQRFHRLAFEEAQPHLTKDIEGQMADQFRSRSREEIEQARAGFESPTPDEIKAATRFDLHYLCAGALDLALAIDRTVAEFADDPPTTTVHLSLDTPLGWIEVHTTGTQTYLAERHYWLILDFDGNDDYRSGGGARSLDQPIGILIDWRGDDAYASARPDGGLFGGGLYGYGFLYDGAGNDRYDSRFLGQGAGCYGVGMLIDRAGDDQYAAQGYAQGAGAYGLGLLIDGGGRDSYRSILASQGFGDVKGHGALIDAAGDDVYRLEDPELWFPSAQNRQRGLSIGQGAGNGVRDDLGTGHSLAGGFGLLIDAAGNDAYRAGLFAQGAGYWRGAGALLDGGGNDTYEGCYYVMGAGAHFAAGALIELGGDDHYTAEQHVALGAGHDFTVGMLIDAAGNDRYEAGGLSLGAANDNGWGLLLDLGGQDAYRTRDPQSSQSLGVFGAFQSGTIREDFLSLGMLIDLGGADAYEGQAGRALRDNALIVTPPRHGALNLKSERAVFHDTEASTAVLRLAPLTGD